MCKCIGTGIKSHLQRQQTNHNAITLHQMPQIRKNKNEKEVKKTKCEEVKSTINQQKVEREKLK